MAEQRHRTVLEYRVDDRQIRGLDQTLHRAFDDKMFAAFEATLERSTKNMEAMTKAAERYEAVVRRNAGGGGGGGGGAPPRAAAPTGGGGGGGADLSAAIGTLARSITQMETAARRRSGPGFGTMAAASYTGSYLGGLASHVGGGGEGVIGQALGGIPLIGGFLASAVNSIQRYYAEYAAQQIQIAGSVGTLGSRSLANPRMFTHFGLSRGAAFGAAAGYASSAGLTGSELTGETTDTALRLEHLGGIADPTAIVGAAGVGGGMTGRDPARVMMQAVSAGLMSGIREARLGQFLSTATQVLEQGRLEGADLSDETLDQMMQGFAVLGMGFFGERASRAMSSAVPTMRGFTPGMDVASLVGLRATGFGTEGGPGYHEALRMFQEAPATVLPRLIETVRNMAPGNEAAQIELMRQIMPRFLGFTPTITQATDLMAGDLTGFGDPASTAAAEGFLGRRAEGLEAAFGIPASEAAYADTRAGVGGSVSGAALSLRAIETSLTQSVLPRVATGIEGILTWLQETYAAFQSGGFGEALTYALGSVFGNLGEILYGDLLGDDSLAGAARDLATNPVETLNQLYDDIAESLPEAPTSTRGSPEDLEAVFRSGTGPGRDRYGRIHTPEGEGAAEGDMGPTSSASDALRRISRDAAFAADALDATNLVGEGDLAMG
jgi:hypothetical protein